MKVQHNIKFPVVDGIEFYACGGMVRDILMNKEPHDLDFVMLTKLSFDEVVNKLKESGAIIYQKKQEFQIILTRIGGVNIDLAFPRTEEGYTDCRHPDKTVRVDDLKLDASRRDFTINSLHMAENGEIIDYFGGIADIYSGLIRCTGNSRDRFREDPLRILRAFRFACTLGFDIAPDTMYEAGNAKELLLKDAIAVDRIKSEINKGLKVKPLRMLGFLTDNRNAMLNILMLKDKNFRFEIVNRS